MSRADILAGRAVVTLYVKTSEFAHGLVSAEARLKNFGAAVESFGNVLGAISPANIIRKTTDAIAALGHKVASVFTEVGNQLQAVGKKAVLFGAGIGALLLSATAHFAHFGDELIVLNQRTGASTQLLSEMGYAARQTGGSLADLETSFRGMERTIGDAANGSEQAQEALGRLGLNVQQLLSLAPDQQFEAIADGLASIEDPTLAAAAALDVLGRSGTALLPAMRNMRELRKEAQLLGLTVTPEQARLGEQLIDKFQGLKEAGFGIVVSAVQALGPALLDAIRSATDLAVRFHTWVDANQETVRQIASIAIGIMKVGTIVAAVGVALQGVGAIIGTAATAFAAFGAAVASVAGVIGVVSVVVALVTKFTAIAGFFSALAAAPVATLTAAIGSLVAVFSGGFSIVSFFGTILSGLFFQIVLPAIAIVAGLTAALAAMAAGAIAGAIAFWKLTDPLTTLKPVLTALLEAVSSIGRAFSEGGIQAAANAAIDGVKQIFLRGTIAIIEMARNALTRLPGFVNAVLGGISNATSGVTGTISRLFREMGPAIRLAFEALSAFAKDVLEQLPAIANYVAGRIVRALMDAFIAFDQWVKSTMQQIAVTLINALAGLGPKIMKAMLTGDIDSVVKEITKAFATAGAAAGGLVAGFAKADAPSFQISGNTVAAMQRVSEQLSKSTSPIAQSHGEAGSPRAPRTRGAAHPGFSAIMGAFDIPKPEITPTDIERYTARFRELGEALSAEQLTPDEFMAGMREMKRDILGIDSTPLEQFYQRLELLNAAQRDGVISSQEWSSEFSKLKRETLGLKADPIEEYHKKLEMLFRLLGEGQISKAEFQAGAQEALPDKAKQIFEETRTPLEKYKANLAELEKMKGILDPDTFDRKKRALGKDYEQATKLKETNGSASFVSYSATAAQSFGAAGGVQERLLKEVQEQRKLAERQLDEMKNHHAAIDRLVNGFRQRRAGGG